MVYMVSSRLNCPISLFFFCLLTDKNFIHVFRVQRRRFLCHNVIIWHKFTTLFGYHKSIGGVLIVYFYNEKNNNMSRLSKDEQILRDNPDLQPYEYEALGMSARWHSEVTECREG